MNRPTTGLVLSGAVAKGAFAGGVVSVIAHQGVALRRLAGASSGALNVAVLAAGVATGRVLLAAQVIEETWRDHAGWHDAVRVSPEAVFSRLGLSSVETMRRGLFTALGRVLDADPATRDRPASPGVEFRFVGTALGRDLPSHERSFTFNGGDFATTEGRERIALSAVASAAFPGLFAPVALGGEFIADGGAVDNSPLSFLIDSTEVDRAIVVAGSAPRAARLPQAPHGVELVAGLIEIIIDDRLARDVRATHRANQRLARVREELDRHATEQHSDITRALGLRHVEIVEVRPVVDLPGTPFSGLSDPALRASYLETGKERASAVLADIGQPMGRGSEVL